MSDAPGGAPQPPRSPGTAVAEAGARGQRPPQAVLQAQPTGVVSAATSATRQVVLGVQAGGSSRLSSPVGALPVGVRLVGSNVQFASTPRLVLCDQSSPQQQAQQLQSSWISISSPNVVTALSRRQVVTTVGAPSTGSPLSSSPAPSPSSLLRPLPATSFVTPPAKRQLPITTPTSLSTTAASTIAARKRLKLDPEEQEEVPALRRRLLAHKVSQLHESRDVYTELLAELFFLQAGGNMMDYLGWRKRPPTPQYTEFTHSRRLDEDAGELERIGVTAELRVAGPGATPVALSKQLPAVVAQLSQQGQVPGRPQGGRHGMVYASRSSAPTSQAPSLPALPAASAAAAGSSTAPPLVPGGVPLVPAASGPVIPSGSSVLTHSPGRSSAGALSHRPGPSIPGTSHVRQSVQRLPIVPGVRQHTRQHSISAVYDTSLGSQEQIVEKAKQEAYVMSRVTELQRDGLWSEKRLPKVQEPSRAKAHWDYLLEEMVWLAADFAQERKWKKAAAKKCARMVQKYFQDKAVQAQKAEKNQELRLKKIASCIAKEIKTFWNNVHKLVEFKHQTMLEERRRQALDQHLSYIVDQTEKYSSWLAESMGKNTGQSSRPESTANSLVHSGGASTPEKKPLSDGEFEPNQSSSDDEETIAKAEAEDAGEEQSEELKLLALESTLPLDDVIKSLPAEVREAVQRGQPASTSTSSTEPKSEIKKEEDEKMEDDDFDASEEDSSDDEDTIQEQEKAERNVDHKQELDELADDNNISMEELLAKYGRPGDPPPGSSAGQGSDAEDGRESISSSESGSEVDSDDESEEEDDGEEKADDSAASGEDIGLSSLLEDIKGITDMDQLAHTVEEYQEYQPTGNTLSSTKVETKVPFLLKHELREYQHVGLEWLVTMYNKRLNGILADEMGLGKTIQTIALLAHLACDKCIWGPHLIVVPTSVMLNWEMEIKKWCPAFKILTYYGSQKERRLKRTGWTKPNAFHICITSYKLVIQDHQSFRRKKWRYLILDEAQNIKNFRSQRWQLLMNFQSQRRLLLTGTPLQNNLMELWSLMHFLMPDVFQSHKEFKEWFVNPVTGMIEGNSEYNEKIIRRLHKVLRPFLLRRLKAEVERQLPKKYEHVVMCRLSKRQRFLYDDFMSRAKTRETLASGNLLSVINVLMQLRKVCNHPNLFEVRPTISPFQMDSVTLNVPSLICYALEYNPMKHVSLSALNLLRLDFEYVISAYMAHRIRRSVTPRRLIEEIDTQPSPPPPTPRGKIRLNVRATAPQPAAQAQLRPGLIQAAPGTSPIVRALTGQTTSNQAVMLRVTGGSPTQGYSVQLVQHAEGVRAIPVAPLASTTATSSIPTNIVTQATIVSSSSIKPTSTITSVTSVSQQDGLGTSTTASPVLQRVTRPAGFAQLVQTPTGKHILLTSSPTPIPAPGTGASTANTVLTSAGHRLTVLSKPAAGVITSTITPLNKVLPQAASTSTPSTSGRPVMRVPPLNVTTAAAGTTTQIVTARPPGTLVATSIVQPMSGSRPTIAATTSGTTALHTARILDARVLAMAESIKKNKEQPQQPKSIFFLTELEETRKRDRKQKLSSLASVNLRRCEACPLYGEDLLSALNVMDTPASPQSLFSNFPWSSGTGYVNCRRSQEPRNRHELWADTDALADAIFSNEERVDSLRQILSRFVLYVPPVNAPRARLLASHASPSCVWSEQRLEDKLTVALTPRTHLLHPVTSAMATQFPDPRLIQYDCGKLQVLEKLLRDLKVGSHRVLIFTQMTRMLDVLEAFLNHQGHIYLRLDGATKVDQRQVLMERFNADKRIFAFILSTRSGGIGVNLTGADTVIFYDSDWNPTMDAQAQDRCHRIGQTRDVHIYRLVSEMTVEENILKKANQKRLLGDLAIEGGNFTTAFFKSSTIQELFNVDAKENDASRRMADVLGSNREREKHRQQIAKEQEVPPTLNGEDPSALTNFESVLAAAEDESDVQATHTARAEAAAELAEFDENIALEDEAAGGAQAPSQQPGEELSKAEQEVQNIVEKLTPVERYAMRVVEESESAWTAEQLAAAEAEIESQKREWELGRLRALQEKQREDEEEAEEQRLATASPSNMLTYSGRDAHSQVWMSRDGKEQMPMWCPPTPPQDDSDVYIDFSLGFLYENSLMSESQLPPVYVRREHKRSRDISIGSEREGGRRPLKLRRNGDDSSATFHAPRSLFDRPTPALIKMRRDLRLQKYRGGSLANSLGRSSSLLGYSPAGLPLTSRPQGLTRPPTAPPPESVPEWMIHEDWSLLQAVQTLQELTLNLIIVSPGHTPNWDMVADMVNCVSRTHRSPKQCRARYESNLIPREEGKVQYDPTPKKIKKQKGIYKTPQTKGGRVLRTSQLYMQDNGTSFTQLYVERFEVVASVAGKRTPTVKPRLGNPTMRNPKHATVLADSGISYDSPLSPIEVAQKRHERIAKLKSQQQVAAASNNTEQLRIQQQQQVVAAASAIKGVISAVASPAGSQSPMSTPPPPPVPVTSVGGLVVNLAQQTALSPQTTATVAVVTSTGTTSSLSQNQALNAAIVTVAGGTTVLQTQALASQIRGGSRTVQEMVAAAANRVTQAVGGSLVSVAQIPTIQTQRLGSTSLVAAPSSAAVAKANVKSGAITTGKTLNQTQVQFYRQQQVHLLQQQRQRDQTIKTLQHQVTTGQATVTSSPTTTVVGTVGGQKLSVGLASPGTSALGVTAVQVTHQRTPQQYLKQGTTTMVGKQTAITRTMTEAEMTALIKRQQQLQQQKAMTSAAVGVAGQVTQVQLPSQTITSSSSSPQVLPQTVQLKTAMMPGAKVTTASQQQLRHLTLHQLQQKKLPQQKGTGKGSVQTQVILQSQKSLPTVTMQQLQLYKQAGQVTAGTSTPVLAHTVMTKGVQGAGQTLQRVIPVSAGQQSMKQTFQVVTTAPGQTIGRPTNQLLTIDSSSGRQHVNVSLASTLGGGIKVTGAQAVTPAQQQAIISHVTAALQCQQGLVRQGVPGQTVRISAPSLAAVVQQQQQQQQLAQQQQLLAQQQAQQQAQQATATVTSQSLPTTPMQQRPANEPQ